MSDEKCFAETLRNKALAVVDEIKCLNHELARLNMEMARTKSYIEAMNRFLVAEGAEPVCLED